MATKVLIIDDDQDILDSTGSILAREGFEIHCADSVERGMELIEIVAPDVVLLDVVFPESTSGGFEAARDIKARFPRLPVIVFSALNRDYTLAFTREQIDADVFLSKPVRADKLMEIIRKLIA
jgi:two-component system phosphate regulon response regulator PhoB